MSDEDEPMDPRPKLGYFLEKNAHALRLRHRSTEIRICEDYEDNAANAKYEPSTIPLKNLKVVLLPDLVLDEYAYGQLLVVRTIESAKQVNGVTTIVEDQKGNVIILCVYNFTDDLDPDLSDLLPIGTVLLLKEPLVKIAIDINPSDCYLRCDCPSDVLLVQEDSIYRVHPNINWIHELDLSTDEVLRHPTPNNSEQWAQRGVAMMQASKYQQATRCYFRALMSLGDNEPGLRNALKVKLAMAYLKRGCYVKAVGILVPVLRMDNTIEEAYAIAGRCFYQVRNYSMAEQCFAARHDLQVRHGIAEIDDEELLKARQRLAEAKDGEFNIYDYFLCREERPGEPIECANYQGPVVIKLKEEVGVFATRDIDAGTLLSVSKAFAFSWSKSTNPLPEAMYKAGSSQHITAKIAQMIMKNPREFGREIYSLIDGNKFGEEPATFFCDPETKCEPVVDVRKIQAVVRCFGFGLKSHDRGFTTKHQLKYRLKDGCGLFSELPSYINHSCVPNTVALDFSDVIFVRSIKKIRENEEIFLAYFTWRQPYSRRLLLCSSRNFVCQCVLCGMDRATSENVLVLRQQIMERQYEIQRIIVEEDTEDVANLIAEIKAMIDTLEATYDNDAGLDFPNKALVSTFYLLLADVYIFQSISSQWQPGEEFNCYAKHLKLRGFDIVAWLTSEVAGEFLKQNVLLDRSMFHSIVGIIKIFNFFKDDLNRHMCIQFLFAFERIYSGGDIEVLKFKFRNIAHLF